MAGEAKKGSHWTADELEAIVADYFEMLAAELSRRPYTKSKHSSALMSEIGRTHRSVEFKHQNISAVLDELGLPWIPGYKPKSNYQNALVGVIERYLSRHSETLETVQVFPGLSNVTSVFVDPPIPKQPTVPTPDALKRLIRKFDPVDRDYRNRSLGKAGESFVLDLERQQLTKANRSDLARNVRWIAAEDGDGAGYDVLSFDQSGQERLIEVKTTNGSARTPFFLSRNERALAAERPMSWRIYRVHLFAQGARIFTIVPPIENAVNLQTEIWRASF